MIMIRLDGFGSYYLTTYRYYKMMIKVKTFNMDLIAINVNNESIK